MSDFKLTSNPPLIFDYPIMIRETHLDSFGHVNNAAYLTILEEARWELITSRGFGLDEVLRRKLGPVILEIKIQFLRELKARDQVMIKTWCTDYSSKIGILEQTIVKLEGNIEACRASFKFGLFDLKLRKIVPPTPEWLKAIGV
jgi:thioesterase III